MLVLFLVASGLLHAGSLEVLSDPVQETPLSYETGVSLIYVLSDYVWTQGYPITLSNIHACGTASMCYSERNGEIEPGEALPVSEMMLLTGTSHGRLSLLVARVDSPAEAGIHSPEPAYGAPVMLVAAFGWWWTRKRARLTGNGREGATRS